jgi:metallo-beta-lactamase family protein
MATKGTITFLGGADTVTGSNFLLEIDGFKILVDCGLFQGFQYASEENHEAFPYAPAEIDFLFITHSHIDHIGRVPKLVRDGFRGKIYSTKATKLIAEPMFQDALSIMRDDARKNELAPLYDDDDIKEAFSLWATVEYRKSFKIGDISVTFYSAGHILGSAMIEFKKDNSVLFSGDLGNKNNLLLDEADIPSGVDYLLCESVYGDRNHEEPAIRKQKLLDAINKTIAKQGTLIIPAFSLERTQHILFEINNLLGEGVIKPVSMYLDSPLAIRLTEIYRNNKELFKAEVRSQIEKGDDIFDFPKLNITAGRDDSLSIWEKPSPKIILAGSGMSVGGRVLQHEKKYLADPKTTILFVGYQAVGSLGRRIAEGEKKVSIRGESVHVRAEVMQIDGYSSHRDSNGLVEFISKLLPKQVYVVLGEPKTSTYLAQRVREELEIKAIVPEKHSKVEILI